MYHREVYDYLMKKGLRTFTHKDILQATNTNCSYSVLPALKRYFKQFGKSITEAWDFSEKTELDPITGQNKTVRKKFKRYFIEGII